MSTAPVIIIFGITGDLSKRKLLPALYHLFSHDTLPADTKIIGISRQDLTAESLLSTVELCVLETDKVCDPVGLARIEAALHTHKLDPAIDDDYEGLKKLLASLDKNGGRERLFYMSIPSSAYAPIIKKLGEHDLNTKQSRLLLEKPFGYDLQSATELVKLIRHDFHENQIYRIDHFLAKETAQNILAFRLHNPIFSPLWNHEHIKRVRVRVNETLGVEGRANFYEQTGALRDMIQSHLLQLLGITLMNLPADMDSDSIHLNRQQFFEQLMPADPAQATRGQYEGYKTEVENNDSYVETYARLHLKHADERWRDTEMILETGKNIGKKKTDITIEFITPHERRRNNLTFHIQPDEGISLDLVVKEPGFETKMRHASLDFHYQTTFDPGQQVDAYERVLMDAIRGDQSLFASDRDVLATWGVLQPVLDAWQASGDGLQVYAPGSDGP